MADRPLMFRTQPSVTSTASPEAVYAVIADLRNHLVWSGERAEDDGFEMLTLEAPEGPATVGTTFTSSGTAGKDTFHDRSVVVEASRPRVFIIETFARLERKIAETWEAHSRRAPELRPLLAQAGHPNDLPTLVNRADRKQLRNPARLAEERSSYGSAARADD